MKNVSTLFLLIILFSMFIFADDDKKEDWLSGGGEEIIVKFESEPGEATVIVDGEVICQATPCTKILTLGEHEIEMRKENHTPKVKKGKITGSKTIKYKLEADCAWLTVKGDEAEVFLDGEYLGEPPIENKAITIGEHKIDYSNSCYYEKSENFTVTNGEKKNIDFKLEPRESAIKVYAQDGRGSVVEADVYVDGKKLGKAPGTFKVPLCSKKVVVKKDEMEYSELLSLPLLESSLKEQQVKTIQASLLYWSAASGAYMDWNKAVKYCENLEEGGYSDWRLPNIDELRTLVVNSPYNETGGYCPINEKAGKLSSEDLTYNCGSYGYTNPNKLGDGSKGLAYLWSSSTVSNHQDYAWGVWFNDSVISPMLKNRDSWSNAEDDGSKYYQVRCVLNADKETEDAKIAAEEKRIADEENRKKAEEEKRIADEKAKIEREKRQKQDAERKKFQWSKKVNAKKWIDAAKYCNKLKEDGHNDWRLPNIDELRTLIQNHPGTETGGTCPISEENWSNYSAFPEECQGIRSSNFSILGDTGPFWSSSNSFYYILGINFSDGGLDRYLKKRSDKAMFRCVRDNK